MFICRVAATPDEVAAHHAVRRAVFVEEQGLFDEDDRDAQDAHALHLIALERATGQVVGAVRCYPADDGVWYGGRLAVLADFRRRGAAIGSLLCKLAENEMMARGVAQFLAYIQQRNVRFFEHLQWTRLGAPVDHCGKRHQIMRASLAKVWPLPAGSDRSGIGAPRQRSLDQLIDALRASPAWRDKQSLDAVAATIGPESWLSGQPLNGDDAAAIPEAGGFALLASEVVSPPLVAANPYLAGRAAVLSNVNDIYAMGGRPVAVVDTVLGGDQHARAEIFRGLGDACTRYGIPLVGGHLTPRNSEAGGDCSLTAAIYGRANRLISSFSTQPGDTLLQVTNLRGRFVPGFGYWSCSEHLSDEALREDLALLPRLAEEGLLDAGRDISMAGLLGSMLMMLELSRVGAVIDLDAVAWPAAANRGRLLDWLLSVPSYGFVLAVRPRVEAQVIDRFAAREIACQAIGRATSERRVRLRLDGAERTLWNLAETPFTGLCSAQPSREVARA